jgi:hypothetical protein
MNQGTINVRFMKKTRGKKSRETIPLNSVTSADVSSKHSRSMSLDPGPRNTFFFLSVTVTEILSQMFP